MKKIILCSSNPIVVKSLYGVLRDEGHEVETVEYPAFAVKKVLDGHYDYIIIDSDPFGLSREEAVEIIKTIAPGLPVIYLGNRPDGTVTPLDLEEVKRMIHSISQMA